MKYPLLRFGHFPECLLRRKLYLDFSGRKQPRYQTPKSVPVPEHRLQAQLPVLEY